MSLTLQENKNCPNCGRVRQVRKHRIAKPLCRYCISGPQPSERCKDCNVVLSVENRSRWSACCVPCYRKRGVIWAKQWRSRNREKVKVAARKWQINNPQKLKEYSQRSKLKQYGMTTIDFESLFVRQNGLCAICSKELTRPYVDHNHITGKVRGLLCSGCNLMLGHAEDSIEVLESALKYLKENDLCH